MRRCAASTTSTRRAELADELARASEHPYLLVDLGECAFIDSTVIGLLVMTCQRMWERDGRLELVIPREATVLRRVLKIAGLTTFLTIHETRDEPWPACRRTTDRERERASSGPQA